MADVPRDDSAEGVYKTLGYGPREIETFRTITYNVCKDLYERNIQTFHKLDEKQQRAILEEVNRWLRKDNVPEIDLRILKWRMTIAFRSQRRYDGVRQRAEAAAETALESTELDIPQLAEESDMELGRDEELRGGDEGGSAGYLAGESSAAMGRYAYYDPVRDR
ncbi:hypothetical protein EJ06DRAFT_533407 [Trichodelitschia bisporula]|uniref:Uncharacterized protein n=1 Tax=Trichodelitschia bisporula TaxID=703511 RepID=A0A6G1HN04_9PEZI|nr:hypothetical protein EJ06DRAFT_533407 [Trichodelitschia bisporula]